MFTGMVCGTVNSTVKHASLTKAAMLIVQPIHPDTGEKTGLAVIAVDVMGAGLGQRVLVSGDGKGAQDLLQAGRDCPVRTAIVGILDPVPGKGG